jgi:hypothetical protein
MALVDAARRLAPADLAAGMQAAFNRACAGGLTMASWASCNRVEYQCGCVSWLELEAGGWVRKLSPCQRHARV